MVRQVHEDAAIVVRTGGEEVLGDPGEVLSLPEDPVAPVDVLTTVTEGDQVKLIHGRDLQHPVCQ